VAVVGVPDAYRGEDPVAYVVLKPEAKDKTTAAEIAAWCREEMAVYKAPRQILFVDALPKTASGKVLKRVLREQARTAK
jgi:acyl-CoA synthetase (AMP-forming)/AMP-acid ligase II